MVELKIEFWIVFAELKCVVLNVKQIQSRSVEIMLKTYTSSYRHTVFCENATISHGSECAKRWRKLACNDDDVDIECTNIFSIALPCDWRNRCECICRWGHWPCCISVKNSLHCDITDLNQSISCSFMLGFIERGNEVSAIENAFDQDWEHICCIRLE